jgi:hypothetical protein
MRKLLMILNMFKILYEMKINFSSENDYLAM